MTQEEKIKLWTDALESGKYKQGTCFLNWNNKYYCCLGVLCEIVVEYGIKITKVKNKSEVTYDGRTGVLPIKVQEWIGLKSNEGKYGSRSLTVQNDNDMTFKEIAEIIKENKSELFN